MHEMSGDIRNPISEIRNAIGFVISVLEKMDMVYSCCLDN